MPLGISSVQLLTLVWLFATPWTAARQASLSITNSQSLLKLMSIESVMPSLPSQPLSSPSPPAFNLSQHQGLFNELALRIRWPEYWSFSFNISPSNEYSGLISFRMDWLDLLAVQGTLKSLLQHHGSKASIFRCSAFFIVQLSQPHMTTGKIIGLTFVSKVISLFFSMLSRLVITCITFLQTPLLSYWGSSDLYFIDKPSHQSKYNSLLYVFLFLILSKDPKWSLLEPKCLYPCLMS